MLRRTPRSTCTDPLLPYPALCRVHRVGLVDGRDGHDVGERGYRASQVGDAVAEVGSEPEEGAGHGRVMRTPEVASCCAHGRRGFRTETVNRPMRASAGSIPSANAVAGAPGRRAPHAPTHAP